MPFPDTQQSEAVSTVPLVVDVDGTLVKGDLLIESIARLLRESPLKLFRLPFWLTKGRAYLKRKVAEARPLPLSTLSLDDRVMQEITNAAADKREVWLVSGADACLVAPLAEHVGTTGYLASDGRTNLVGFDKAAALVKRFGEGGFDYVGNALHDLPVWRRARRAIGVNLSVGLMRKLRAMDRDARLLPRAGHRFVDYLQALRPHQWLKNMLVFAPIVAAHETQTGTYLVAFGVFAAMSACASGTYLFNDLCDLPYDRQHHGKRLRPVAAGNVSLSLVILLGVALMAGGLATAFWLSFAAGLWVLLYLMLTLAYSLWIKRWIFADVVVLALLYTVRLLAGAAAASIVPSGWFLGFAVFAFLALALVKRRTELHNIKDSVTATSTGRGYLAEDRVIFSAFSAAASFASVVVLMLFIQTPSVALRYQHPELLWLLCPLLLYWFGRVTLLANRGMIDDDPLTFTIRDRASWFSGIAFLAVFAAAL